MTICVPAGIDPELARVASLQPDLDYSNPVQVRAEVARAFEIAGAFRRPPSGLAIREQEIPARDGSPPVRIRVYERSNRQPGTPALVFFHGGAFVAGGLAIAHLRVAEIAQVTGMLVVSVDYRLAPENPFPLGLEDCQAATAWVMANAVGLGVDAARVAVGGAGAGGALAAAVALKARDNGTQPPVFQLLLYPVTDDRVTVSAREFTQTPGWNASNNAHMWRHYLSGQHLAGQSAQAYAAPARAGDLTGLPPAYVLTAEFDPLRDEGIEYARRLIAAGVPTGIHQFAGTFHGFDEAAPGAAISRQALGEQCSALLRGCGFQPEAPLS